MPSILVIDDELALVRQLRRALEVEGHQVATADTGSEAVGLLREGAPDLVLLDLRLPDASGLDVLREIREIDASVPVVLMTAYSSVQDAVEAMRRGANDYLPKPLDLEKLRHLVGELIARQRTARELDYHRSRDRARPTGLVSGDARVRKIFEQVERLADAGLPPGKRPAILLTGETGTGKGITARAIHGLLGEGPFIELNCTAIPASLVEAELFGHERGSFTDARAARPGLFEAAEGGTVFLDEIGHLPADLQAKFLKVIEEKRVRRIGSTRDRPVDVHVIAATNRDLGEAVASGDFRADLYHRLQVLAFELPPLRERPADVSLLARHFCTELGHQYRGRAVDLGAGAESVLARYPWPGNVRELRNVIERALLLSSGDALEAADFEVLLHGAAPRGAPVAFQLPEGGVDLEKLEQELIRQALERTGGNRTRAAALLGLSRHALRYRLEKHGIDPG